MSCLSVFGGLQLFKQCSECWESLSQNYPIKPIKPSKISSPPFKSARKPFAKQQKFQKLNHLNPFFWKVPRLSKKRRSALVSFKVLPRGRVLKGALRQDVAGRPWVKVKLEDVNGGPLGESCFFSPRAFAGVGFGRFVGLWLFVAPVGAMGWRQVRAALPLRLSLLWRCWCFRMQMAWFEAPGSSGVASHRGLAAKGQIWTINIFWTTRPPKPLFIPKAQTRAHAEFSGHADGQETTESETKEGKPEAKSERWPWNKLEHPWTWTMKSI